jgi:hypothetical protein
MRHERTPTPGILQRACRRLAQGELPAGRKSSILVLIGILPSTTERAMNIEPNPWHEWIGRAEQRVDCVTAAPLTALAATLDRDDPAPRRVIRCRRRRTGCISGFAKAQASYANSVIIDLEDAFT